MAHKPVIGLTGGPGAGKSTVAAEFGKQGCAVIDADAINHEVLGRSEVAAQVCKMWGNGVIGPDSLVDRGKLGAIVLQSAEELKRLTDLVHPLILERERELIQQYQENTEFVAIVLDVPLLLEVGQQSLCDAVVFVAADESIRRQRLRKRGWTAERIKNIENLQLALDIKAQMSDYTVANNSCMPDTAAQVEAILARIIPS